MYIRKQESNKSHEIAGQAAAKKKTVLNWQVQLDLIKKNIRISLIQNDTPDRVDIFVKVAMTQAMQPSAKRSVRASVNWSKEFKMRQMERVKVRFKKKVKSTYAIKKSLEGTKKFKKIYILFESTKKIWKQKCKN